MLFRVWAYCTNKDGRRIEKVNEDALKEAMDDIYSEAKVSYYIDDSRDDNRDEIDFDKMDKIYSKIWDWWEENKYLNVGDHMIVEKESIDEVQIPNNCGYDTEIIFADDIKYLEDRRWYAVLTDREDNDLGMGSYNKEEAFRKCKEMNDRYEEEGKPREALIAEIDNRSDDPFCTGEYSDEEVIDYLNYVEANKKEEEANKSVNNMKQTEKEDEEEI